ncbi:MAG: toll/interleukin-1 receptor domain-containing protein [Gammaproteobacteria bacterium]
MATARYKAFISYSHRDERWARWLHRKLETYRVPKRLVGQPSPLGPIPPRLTPIFRDRDELPTATDLGAVIQQALDDSESLIVICSPAAAASRWVNEEIRYFRRLGRGDRVFCLIVDGEPGGGADAESKQECFPEALTEQLDAGGPDASQDHAAADIRPRGDGKQSARLKVIAGLLGVGLDELRQREQQRRQRRLIAVAASAVAGMVIAIGLATAALMARAEADRQRLRAEQEAQTATETTEFLVSLFEVVDPSEARGNTITAREILDRGAEKINRELLDQPAVRSNLLGTMGRVYTGLGLYAQATSLLDSALEASGDINANTPAGEIQTLIALAAALFLEGDYDRSQEIAAEAVRQARDMDSAPGEELVEALIVLADVQTHKGVDESAESNYREALTVDASLHEFESAERAQALAGLAASMMYQGRLEESEPLMAEALAIRERVLGSDHPLTIESLNNLATVAYAQHRLSDAEHLVRQAVLRARRVWGDEHPETASQLNNLGLFLLEQGLVEEAETVLSESVLSDRRHKDPTHDQWVFSLNSLALSKAARGDYESAEPLYLEALEIARLHDHRMEGPIAANLADLYCNTGLAAEGLATAALARISLTDDYPESDWRLAYLDSVEGGCRAAVGETELARALLDSGLGRLEADRGPDWLFTQLASKRVQRFMNDTGVRIR